MSPFYKKDLTIIPTELRANNRICNFSTNFIQKSAIIHINFSHFWFKDSIRLLNQAKTMPVHEKNNPFNTVAYTR